MSNASATNRVLALICGVLVLGAAVFWFASRGELLEQASDDDAVKQTRSEPDQRVDAQLVPSVVLPDIAVAEDASPPEMAFASSERTEVVTADGPSTWVSFRYGDGEPAAGMPVFGFGPAHGYGRQVEEAFEQKLGVLSDRGRLELDFELESIRGITIAYNRAAAVVVPVSMLVAGSEVAIPELVPQSFRLVLPADAPEGLAEAFTYSATSYDAIYYGRSWDRDRNTFVDLLASHRLTPGGPLEKLDCYVESQFQFSATEMSRVLPLPATRSLIGRFHIPFGWATNMEDLDQKFVPGGDEVVLRANRIPIRTVSFWRRSNGEQVFPPDELRLALKRSREDGKWESMFEVQLRTRPAESNAKSQEFTIDPKFEGEPCSVMAVYRDRQFESEMYWHVPNVVTIDYE